jgi:uncharacterized membrane protein
MNLGNSLEKIMNKISVWFISVLLIVYFIFTSGLYYWASGSDQTLKMIVPFSWSLSAEEKGFTPIATKGDIDCIKWIIDEGDNTTPTICDSSGVYLMTGWWGRSGVPFRDIEAAVKMFMVFFPPEQTNFYIYITHWNTKYREFVDCSDVGMKIHVPYNLLSTEKGLVMELPNYRTGTVKSIHVKEVYRSGDSFVYQTIGEYIDDK